MKYFPYKQKAVKYVRPYVPGEDLTSVSVSKEDNPAQGGYIGINPNNPEDRWFIAKDYLNKNMELDPWLEPKEFPK